MVHEEKHGMGRCINNIYIYIYIYIVSHDRFLYDASNIIYNKEAFI
jgi:hypothetical protein